VAALVENKHTVVSFPLIDFSGEPKTGLLNAQTTQFSYGIFTFVLCIRILDKFELHIAEFC